VQGTHGDHRSVQRIDVARDDGLQRHDDAGRRDDRVRRAVRHRTWPPMPVSVMVA